MFSQVSVFAVSFGFLFASSVSSAAVCETKVLTLAPTAATAAACATLQMEGEYSLTTCASGHGGKLQAPTGPQFSLFQDSGVWAARADYIDFDTGTTTTESYRFSSDLTEMSYSLTTSKRGVVHRDLLCEGTFAL